MVVFKCVCTCVCVWNRLKTILQLAGLAPPTRAQPRRAAKLPCGSAGCGGAVAMYSKARCMAGGIGGAVGK